MKLTKIIIFTSILSCIIGNSFAQTLENYIANYNPSEASYIAQQIRLNGQRYHIDPLFLSAVFKVESAYDNSAVSYAGALGIAQLMPATAQEVGANPYDIASNISGGSYYLRQMLNAHSDKGQLQYNYALASYNAGLGNVGNTIPSYTYDYIQSVQDEYYKQKNSISDLGATISNSKHLNSLQQKKALLAKLKAVQEARKHK